jgi:chromosome condensin MukBEF complex kleisin-like MukF subunit
MLVESHETMIKKIDRVIDSGAIDIDAWDRYDKPMIIPKCIVTAILQNESEQYAGKGTSFQKQIKKEVRNIRYFL